MMHTKISKLKDDEKFYLSPRKKVLYRLDTIEGSQAVITSIQSGRTYHKPKKSLCYRVTEQEPYNVEDGL